MSACGFIAVGPVGMLNGSASATSLLADKTLGAAYQLALGTDCFTMFILVICQYYISRLLYLL